MLSFRIESFVFSPSILLLPLAVAFYWVISIRELRPDIIASRRRTQLLLGGTLLGGFAGAWAYGATTSPQSIAPLNTWLEVHFGSFGGYWGALAAGILLGRLIGAPSIRVADALVPGILVGGMVARIGCVFTGCCRGPELVEAWLHGLQPLRPWPLYDIAALALNLCLIMVLPRRSDRFKGAGITLGLFLLAYGLMRFALEFAREAAPLLGPLTPGQIACLLQAFVGAVLLLVLKRDPAKG